MAGWKVCLMIRASKGDAGGSKDTKAPSVSLETLGRGMELVEGDIPPPSRVLSDRGGWWWIGKEETPPSRVSSEGGGWGEFAGDGPPSGKTKSALRDFVKSFCALGCPRTFKAYKAQKVPRKTSPHVTHC